MKDIDCTSHWAELVFGVEVSIVKNFHMGWAVRYKREIASTKSDYAKPNCIPGYGYTTNATCWGGTYSLIFDLNWGMKKSHKRGVNVEIRDIPVKEDKEAIEDKEDLEDKEDIEDIEDNENGTEDEEQEE